jgi:hypothetical protein
MLLSVFKCAATIEYVGALPPGSSVLVGKLPPPSLRSIRLGPL